MSLLSRVVDQIFVYGKQAGLSHDHTALGLSIAVPFLWILFTHQLSTQRHTEWFKTLKKPKFQPPPWIFGPVWTTLYTLMGISSWIVWKETAQPSLVSSFPWWFLDHPTHPLTIYFVQLFLNQLWDPLFFGNKKIRLALLDIVLLTGTVLYTIIKFHQVDTWAAQLLYPYLLWLCIATYLNFSIVVLNPHGPAGPGAKGKKKV